MSRFIDRTGQKFNHITIVKELGHGMILGLCDLCNKTHEFDKARVVIGKTKTCGCQKRTNRVGEQFNGLVVTEELGNSKIMAKCIHCGSIKEYYKSSVVDGNYRSCGCIKNRTQVKGKTFGALTILEDYGNNRVKCRCNICNGVKEFRKNRVVTGSYKSCGCTRYKSVTGKGAVVNNFEILEVIDGRNVKAKCLLCNHIDIYNRDSLKSGAVNCRKCGLTKNFKNKIINNIQVLQAEYKGRDGNKYYKCRCLVCNEELILNREEIVKYECNKKRS